MNYTRLRFATTFLATAGGALLGIGAFIFAAGTQRWLGLGVGAAIGTVTVLAFATSGRGPVQRTLDLLLLPVCIWTLVSARTIELSSHGASAGLVKWLSLSAGAAIFAVGVIGLIAHELSVERDLRWAFEQLGGDASATEDAESESDAESEPDAEAKPESEADTEPEADTKPEADAKPETKPEPETEPHPEPEAGAGDTAETDMREGEAHSNGSNGHGARSEFIPTPSGQPSLARRPMWLAPPPSDDEEDWRPSRRAGA